MEENKISPHGKISKEIIVLSVIIILYSIPGMPTSSFDSYASRLRHLPEQLIWVRFIFSIAIRLALLISGIGILFRRNIFRKVVLFISFFTIFTVYWKHPVIYFKKFFISNLSQGALSVELLSRVNFMSWICVIICYIVDISVALCLIYFFTRPKIKEQFK